MDKKNPAEPQKTPKKDYSTDEIRRTIQEIKKAEERDFQERLKHMTPEEQAQAIRFANHLL